MRSNPKISVVKGNDSSAGPSFQVSGKALSKTPKVTSKADKNTNNNEFTFSAKEFHDNSSRTLKSTTKNPFEKTLNRKAQPEEDVLTKNEIFEKLGITNPETEKVVDLSATSIAGGGLAKSKKEITTNLISNLETEIHKLKHKRDTIITAKLKTQQDEIRRALDEEPADDQVLIHRDVDRQQTIIHPISSLQKPTLENVEALLRAHQEKMSQIEVAYQEKKKHLLLEQEFEAEAEADIPKKKRPQSTKAAAATSTSTKSKENKAPGPNELKNYSKVDPPPELNSYMTNPYLLKKKKETKKAQRVKIEKKRDDLKSYKEKFIEYLEVKKDQQDRPESQSPERVKDFDRYQPTSPNPVRARTANKFDADQLADFRGSRTKSQGGRGPHSPSPHKSLDNSRNYGTNNVANSSFMSPKNKIARAASAKRFVDVDNSREVIKNIPEGELKLLQWIFSVMKKGDKPNVSKEEIYNYILKSQEIIELYDVDPVNLKEDLAEFPSKYKTSMSFNEFILFLCNGAQGGGAVSYAPEEHHGPIDRVQEISLNRSGDRLGDSQIEQVEIIRKDLGRDRNDYEPPEKVKRAMQKVNKAFENVCLLNDELIQTLKDIFHQVDKYDDLVVPRLELIRKVRDDVRVARHLHKPAVHITEIDKHLSLERILRQIEDEERDAIAEQKKAKEYISLKQFMNYFLSYETPSDLADKIQVSPKKKSKKITEDDDDEFVEILPEHLQFFKDVFEQLPKKHDAFVETIILLDEIRGNEYYIDIKSALGRKKSKNHELPNETIEQTINRIEDEAEGFISWDEFSQFFARRGRPLNLMAKFDQYEKDLITSGIVKDQKSQGAQTGSKMLKPFERDGYESDPEFHTYSKEVSYDYKLNRSNINEVDVDIDPTLSGASKYMRYKRDDKDSIFDKNAIKKALKEQEEEIEIEREERETGISRRKVVIQEPDEEAKQSKIFGQKFGALNKEGDDFKITVPRPFEFDSRDRVKPKSIRERKLEEMILEKHSEELQTMNFRFRAKNIPKTTTEPLYQKIIQAQEDRRLDVKKNSIAITKMREAPFSFYLRDKAAQEEKKNEGDPRDTGHSFKANPVPAHVQIPDLWKKMEEEDVISRKERVATAAQQNLVLASLPPRMAAYEKKKKEEDLRRAINEKNVEKEKTKKTFVAKPIPDFQKEQGKFQELLDRNRKSKRPTQPQPFNFQETTKGVTREYLDRDNFYKKADKDDNKKDPFEAVEKLRNIKPKYQPPTTKKMVAMMDKLKAEREDRERKMEARQREDQERYEKQQRVRGNQGKMKAVVQNSPAIQTNTKEQQERAERIKAEVKKSFMESQRKFQEMKDKIDSNVQSRPLLVEQETEKNQRIQMQAMKDLSKLKSIMEESGVKNTDQYFNQEEQDQLADAEYLKKHGYGQEFQQ